jgi:2-C-methyl-D-erythritol 2,4-cyclodiphosphate synthase
MIGFGYDSHRLASEGRLLIGGIEISSDIGVIAHSDGDVLAHALIDALLGATGNGDIGTLFPDNDPAYKGIDSMLLLDRTMKLLEKQYTIINIDITLLLEKPKLAEYKNAIRQNVAQHCSVNAEFVNIKAKTNERMGFVGRSEGIACYCVVQLDKSE